MSLSPFSGVAGLVLGLLATSVVGAAEGPALPAGPPWLDGYAARFALQITGPDDRAMRQSVIATLPVGGLCRDDAGDITVQTQDGRVLPVAVLSHTPGQHAIIQFQRQPATTRYWASVGHPTAQAARMEPMREGVTLEVRRWSGQSMDSWPAVREALAAAPLLDSFNVGEVVQASNPARPGDPLNFAASYRGWLTIDKPGPYRFFVNSDDAAFLFVNGFLVTERTGQNLPKRGKLPVADVGGVIELTPGVHHVEVHHVCGSRPTAYGLCTLMWFPQGQKGDRQRWELIDKDSFAQADHARVLALQSPPAPAKPAAVFVHGIDDSLTTQSGMKLYLVRFAAHSEGLADDQQLHWDFGDGVTATGRELTHVYFRAGDYTVKLRVGAGPEFRQTVHVWPAPGKTSPFSPQRVVQWFVARDWKHGDVDRVYQMFDFLLICDHPTRWPVMAQVTQFLLDQNDADPQLRADLYAARVESLGHLGKGDEAIKLADAALEQFARLPTQRLVLQMVKARVLHRRLRDLAAAARQYEAIIEEHRRLDDPQLRIAAVRWGDVCNEAGDAEQAARCYRLAETLGGAAFQSTAVTEAISRGAQMRIAEQALNKGDLRLTAELLRKLELRQPEQKLSGLYRLISGEAARLTGYYEESLRDYETLLRMTQWAGYHDRATFGVADTYRRMEDLARARQWLATLRKNYPEYGDKEKLDSYQALLELCVERQAQGGWPLQEKVDSFEPEADKVRPAIGAFALARGLGMDGPNVVAVDNHGKYIGYFDFEMPLKNLVPDGWYWVELWYRESLLQPRHRYHAHIHTWLFSDKGKMHDGFRNEGTMYFNRTYGRWRKFGFMHKAAPTVDGKLALSLRHSWGDMELDRLSIQRVTDREHEALNSFIEGIGGETEPTNE